MEEVNDVKYETEERTEANCNTAQQGMASDVNTDAWKYQTILVHEYIREENCKYKCARNSMA